MRESKDTIMENRAVEMLNAAGYIPVRQIWTPPDEALYGVEELFNLPISQAEKLCFKAIKHSFIHWYNNCDWYHRYCNEFDFNPRELKTSKELVKIPLVSHRFYKTYLEGPDFAKWLSQICMVDFNLEFSKKNPPHR
jgi:phenylacetate-coenzyme A ligase PaaK-like adenylate-forming protein